jgi:hypothetical protein
MASSPNRKARRAARFSAQLSVPHGPIPVPANWRQHLLLIIAKCLIKAGAALTNLHDSIPSVLGWFRTAGLVSILLGSAGLIKTFYLPSVLAIYSGLALLAIDCLFEKLRSLFKFAIIGMLLSLAAVFTQSVTLRKNPMQYQYSVYKNGLDLVLRNDSMTDDYDDVDIVFTISKPASNVFVGETKFLSEYPSCYFAREVGTIPNGHVSIISQSPEGVISDYPDTVRLRCGKVPKETSVRMRVMTVNQTPDLKGIVSVTPRDIPSAKGQFSGAFRVIRVDTPLLLVGNP